MLLALSRYDEALLEPAVVAQPDALVLLRRGLALDRALAFSALHLPLDDGERHLLARRVAARIVREVAPLPAREAAEDDGSAIRGRVRAAADRFRDLSRISARDAALRIRRDGIDLLLDAIHYSATTTACDALGAGLPVLTLKGATFASRAGESLLRAAGMPEPVAAGPDAYMKSAAALGNDPAELARLKAKLKASRATAPLFDTTSRVRQLEAVFAEMYRRHRARMPPTSFGL